MVGCLWVLVLVLVWSWMAEAQVGVNWGSQLSHPLPARVVVRMLRDNNVSRVKLFDADPRVMKALAADSTLEVMVGIPNDMLRRLAASQDAADQWVSQNISRYLSSGKRGANIRYVAVGNEPFLTAYNKSFESDTLPALKNIQGALSKAKLGNTIKATVPINADVLSNSPLPSGGVFRKDIETVVVSIVQFLEQNGAPFTINLYPFISLQQDPNFPKDFAFFGSNSANFIRDGPNTYTNVFDANYDLLVSALKAAGFPNMAIIVGEVGWPTDADVNANLENARNFNQGFLQHALSSQGTPLRPGSPLHFYLFSLIDEDQKSIAPGNFERHWGIFTYDGQAKYLLDMSGKGNPNALLVNAREVEYLPRRWCVLKPTTQISGDSVSFACANADCTALTYGGSCNFLSARENASYAFNSYYQMTDQLDTSCNFQGQATITNVDPSVQPCRFIRQILPLDDTDRAHDTTSPAAHLLFVLALTALLLAFTM